MLGGEIVDDAAQGLPRALAIAEDVAANTSLVSTRVMKDMIYRGVQSPEEAHLFESKIPRDLFNGKDVKEGIQSFKEKRPPRFEATVEADAPGDVSLVGHQERARQVQAVRDVRAVYVFHTEVSA